jgi:hypothetical protein
MTFSSSPGCGLCGQAWLWSSVKLTNIVLLLGCDCNGVVAVLMEALMAVVGVVVDDLSYVAVFCNICPTWRCNSASLH